MALYNREKEYLSLLATGTHTVKDLAKKLFISEPTVRRDIIALKEKELVSCRRGIVELKKTYADQRIPLFIRNLEYNKEKQEIALKAIKHIKDGDVIMIDASTTAYQLLPHLTSFKDIILITNGAKTALESASMGIKTICTGGEITLESFSYVGSDAENILRKYNADIAFFSCRGLSQEHIATDNSILENSIRRIMIENSKKSYLLCDKSKYGKIYLNTLCYEKEITGVITD